MKTVTVKFDAEWNDDTESFSEPPPFVLTAHEIDLYVNSSGGLTLSAYDVNDEHFQTEIWPAGAWTHAHVRNTPAEDVKEP